MKDDGFPISCKQATLHSNLLSEIPSCSRRSSIFWCIHGCHGLLCVYVYIQKIYIIYLFIYLYCACCACMIKNTYNENRSY